MGGLEDGSVLHYPNVFGLPASEAGGEIEVTLTLRAAAAGGGEGAAHVVVRTGSAAGPVLGAVPIKTTGGWARFAALQIPLTIPRQRTDATTGKLDLVLTFESAVGGELLRIDSLSFAAA